MKHLEFSEAGPAYHEAQSEIGLFTINSHSKGFDLIFEGNGHTVLLCTTGTFDLAVFFAQAWLRRELLNTVKND